MNEQTFETFMAGLETRTLKSFKVCHVLLRLDGTYTCLDVNVSAPDKPSLMTAIRQHFAAYHALNPAPAEEWRKYFDGENVEAINIRGIQTGRGFAMMPIRAEMS